MFKKMFTNGAGRIVLFAFVLPTPCVQSTSFGQALNMDGQSANFFRPWAVDVVPSPHNRFGTPMTPDMDDAQNESDQRSNYAFTRECS